MPSRLMIPRPRHDPDSNLLGWKLVDTPLIQRKRLWLAVEKVIHHDDVVLIIIIRPRGYVARRDPNPRDACVFKKDPEE